MRLLQPSSSIQVSKKNPDRFIQRAAKIIRTGFGQPSIFNADLIVQELVRMGKSVADARSGGSSGCVEVGAFGKEAYILTGYFNLPKVLELTLHNGLDPRTGKQLGLQTGDRRSRSKTSTSCSQPSRNSCCTSSTSRCAATRSSSGCMRPTCPRRSCRC